MADFTIFTYAPDALTYSGGSFTLASGYDWKTDRNKIEYTDDDKTLNGDYDNNLVGDDINQIGKAFDDQGNLIESGTVYVQEYAEIQAPDGTIITIDRIEVDGVHVGYIPSEPLKPGATYKYVGGGNVGDDGNGNDNQLGHDYYKAHSVPCLAIGTQVLAEQGWMRVEDLCAGDKIMTLDHGLQPIRWTFRDTQCLEDVEAKGMPIEIKAGALGQGRPARPMTISPQHRVLIGHETQGRQLAAHEYFVPAKALVGLPGVRVMSGRRHVEWVHLACATHEVMIAEGAYVDTLLLGKTCVSGLSGQLRLSLHANFGHPARARTSPLNGPAARPCLAVAAARKMMFETA